MPLPGAWMAATGPAYTSQPLKMLSGEGAAGGSALSLMAAAVPAAVVSAARTATLLPLAYCAVRAVLIELWGTLHLGQLEWGEGNTGGVGDKDGQH